MVPHPVVPARAVHLARVGPPRPPFTPTRWPPPGPFHRGKRDVIKFYVITSLVTSSRIHEPREDAERIERLRTQVTAGGWGCTRRRERA